MTILIVDRRYKSWYIVSVCVIEKEREREESRQNLRGVIPGRLDESVGKNEDVGRIAYSPGEPRLRRLYEALVVPETHASLKAHCNPLGRNTTGTYDEKLIVSPSQAPPQWKEMEKTLYTLICWDVIFIFEDILFSNG